MWFLRLLAILMLISVVGSILAYGLTGQKKYRVLAWRLVRYGLVIAFLFFALLTIERLALVSL